MAPTLDAIPPLRSGRGNAAPRRPDQTARADKAYDARVRRQECRALGIRSRIARGGIEQSDRLGGIAGWSNEAIPGSTEPAALTSRYKRRADI